MWLLLRKLQNDLYKPSRICFPAKWHLRTSSRCKSSSASLDDPEFVEKTVRYKCPKTLSRTWLGQWKRQNRSRKKNTPPHGRTSSSKFEALSKNFEVMLYDVNTVLILISGSNQASPKTETGQILALPDRSAALTWRCRGDCFAAKEQEYGCFLFQIPWKMVCLAYF